MHGLEARATPEPKDPVPHRPLIRRSYPTITLEWRKRLLLSGRPGPRISVRVLGSLPPFVPVVSHTPAPLPRRGCREEFVVLEKLESRVCLDATIANGVVTANGSAGV